jgi:hypothetical protein
VLMISSLLSIVILLTVCNFVTHCFNLIVYCNLALCMTNSTFSPTCGDNGCVCVCMRARVCMLVYTTLVFYIIYVLPDDYPFRVETRRSD